MASPVTSLTDSLPDATTLATNLTVLITFLGIVGAGILAGFKKVREFTHPTKAASPATAQIAAATLLENVTLSEWSRTNREVSTALTRLCELMIKHHDELVDHRHETVELRHAMQEFMQHLKHRGT